MRLPRPLTLRLLSALSSATLLAVLTGCGAGLADTSSTGTLAIHGKVMGGQQPIANAQIYMYSPGLSGSGPSSSGSASTSILTHAVQSDSFGSFNLGGAFTCANVNAQAYMVTVGGNPGLAPGTSNAAAVMVSALGRCGDLYTTQYVEINELTTAAAAWALGAFYASYDHIGASATNSLGMANAFANAALLVDPHTGQIPTSPANISFEAGKIYALANSLTACVNSAGATSAPCQALFTAATPAGGTAPIDILTAAVNVTRNPGNNVTGVFYATGTVTPYPTLLATPPNDWTMSVTVTGGGLSQPTALGIDASGYVWAADYPGVLSAFTAQGTPLSSTGFGIGQLGESYGLTISTDGSVWSTTEEKPFHYPTHGNVWRYAGSAAAHPGQYITNYGDYTMDYPVALSADTDGSVVVANYANSSASRVSSTGTITGGFGSSNASFPVALAVDAQHGLWLANNSDNTVTHVSSTGAILARPTCCNGANGIAVDAAGNAWVSNYYGNSASEVSAAGTTALSAIRTGGIAYPAGIVIDGSQDVWIANYRGQSISKLAGNSNTVAAGTALSPSTGYGRDANLLLPFSIGVDFSGDVWVSNYSPGNLVEFIGLAAPTLTPVSATPATP